MNQRSKILIVDDKEQNLITLEAILGDFEVDFIKALSGNEALALSLENDFALAIIDIQMPDMDGYETVKLMRQVKRTRNLPIIYVSAIYKEEFHVVKGIEAGAVDFIVKPILPEILKGKVKVFLELYRHRVHLEDLVKQRTEELERANLQFQREKEKAEAATTSKSLFLANMSHEIRTPLNGIIGMTNHLKKTTLNEEQTDIVDIISTSGDYLLAIINDILDFSKIESGQIELEEKEMDILKLIDELVKTFKPRLESKQVELTHHLSINVPRFVIGDQVRVRQIFINIIGNAIKFTAKGSIKIEGRVLSEEGDTIKLKFHVIDTGIGIPTERTDHIFKLFSQGETSTTRKYGGTGLGLAISKNLCELMNGSIGVKSQPGVGSDFFFSIPFRIARLQTPALEPANRTLSKINDLDIKELRILLAEDNLINQKVASISLKKLGCKYDIAIDGIQAVAMYKKNDYDAILMDIQMPEMDGIEATKVIRQLETAHNELHPITIIAMTANAMIEDQDRYRRAGMDGFIPKPFKPDKLAEVLSNVKKR
ncbi:MAG TPA: hybrid sensor histidine kinase/response regulator [Bacteroidales bacterium]|nr:MAG: hypothetical protein A2X11_01255 [Bacteroidetes bacterium GWE2_42_24]OFY27326.1 MAG: hypothetical protein A2X09_00465 [Bacteroidetes bacterium GWF2_43_11]HAQ65052.1 hybrid sensor histidine kinase/response regulator [Bacteroidales bacterium]HBZ65928.1 hybrid sensor histidine kinase/response regulator [Bacteroidales bacterium]